MPNPGKHNLAMALRVLAVVTVQVRRNSEPNLRAMNFTELPEIGRTAQNGASTAEVDLNFEPPAMESDVLPVLSSFKILRDM